MKQKDQKKETIDQKNSIILVFGSLETELIQEKAHWKAFQGPRGLTLDFDS